MPDTYTVPFTTAELNAFLRIHSEVLKLSSYEHDPRVRAERAHVEAFLDRAVHAVVAAQAAEKAEAAGSVERERDEARAENERLTAQLVAIGVASVESPPAPAPTRPDWRAMDRGTA